MTKSDNEPNNHKAITSVNPKIIELIKDLNINTKTLLSTDYLNHFNEIIMMIAMIPEMPEILEECKEWQPKSYIEHFAYSSLSYRFIAVELYRAVPDKTLKVFEDSVAQTNNVVFQTIERLGFALQYENQKQIAEKALYAQKALQKLTEFISGIIHCSEKALSQEEIDTLLNF